MGRLVDGQWTTAPKPARKDGRFVRKPTQFRDFIRADGSTPYAAEAGRYHLYVSWACPWAHRTLITRALLGLEDAISLSIVDPFMGDDGWTFGPGPDLIEDTVGGARFLHQVYTRARADYTGRATVPVLWDRQRDTIVSNESREIIRMFDREMRAHARHDLELAPPALHAEIDAAIDANYDTINNGVYRAGFARSQEAYEEAVQAVFAGLERCEALLSRQPYLCGDRFTEADICLFPTLLRFELVYYAHFKCNLRALRDHPNLWAYTRAIYQRPGVAEVCKLDQIKQHYYRSHESINPTRIVPGGPELDLWAPHDR